MLITTSNGFQGKKALLEKEKIIVLHSECVDELLQNNKELRKDANNGWTKKRLFRHIAELSEFAWLEMQRLYPEVTAKEPSIRNRAYRKALASPLFAPYRVVEKGI